MGEDELGNEDLPEMLPGRWGLRKSAATRVISRSRWLAFLSGMYRSHYVGATSGNWILDGAGCTYSRQADGDADLVQLAIPNRSG